MLHASAMPRKKSVRMLWMNFRGIITEVFMLIMNTLEFINITLPTRNLIHERVKILIIINVSYTKISSAPRNESKKFSQLLISAKVGMKILRNGRGRVILMP